MPVTRTSKMLAYVNYRMRVTIADGRQIVGRFMAFDRHMNLVLSDAEEFRKLPPKKGLSEEERQTRRVLGFVLLRGEEVVSLTVERDEAVHTYICMYIYNVCLYKVCLLYTSPSPRDRG